MTKTAGSGSASGSISLRHEFADPEPDQHQNVMDPQHCFLYLMERRETVHIGGVNVRPAAQQHLHLAAIPGRAGRQEHAPVAKSDLVQ